MSRIRQFAIAGGTFAVALGIGFVMQNEDALAARFVSDVAPPSAPLVGTSGLGAAPLVLAAGDAEEVRPAGPTLPVPDIEMAAAPPNVPAPMTSPTLPQAPMQLAALETDTPILDVPSPFSALPDCTTTLGASPAPAAMVDLSLVAPCAPLTTVTIHHQGMMFSILTDRQGMAQVRAPALAETAVFIADVFGGEGAVAVVDVPEMAGLDRAVLQWEGDAGLGIHALEFGATYGEPGHVWADAAGSVDLVLSGTGGFLVELGDPEALIPRMAEVYTYPSGTSERAGKVILNVEAVVTQANCGDRISAQSIQVSPGAPPFASDLTMAVPGCESAGEYLLLSNMLLDLTLAAR